MPDRDGDQFDARAARYDSDFLGRHCHRVVHEAAAEVAAPAAAAASTIERSNP